MIASHSLEMSRFLSNALCLLFPTTCGKAYKLCSEPLRPPHSEEAVALRKAGTHRKIMFAAGRDAARSALAQIGVSSVPIAVGLRGEPIWPSGFIGSIAHVDAVAVAAVARSDEIRAIGIDVEYTDTVTHDLWPQICVPKESAYLVSLEPSLRNRTATAIFCIKEAFYKFQFPHTRAWLNFREAEVSLDPENNTYALTSRIPIQIGLESISSFQGRYVIGSVLTIAGIAYPARNANDDRTLR